MRRESAANAGEASRATARIAVLFMAGSFSWRGGARHTRGRSLWIRVGNACRIRGEIRLVRASGCRIFVTARGPRDVLWAPLELPARPQMRRVPLTATIAAALLPAAVAAAPQLVNNCQTISQPGSYAVNRNLNANGDCLVVA